MSCLSPRPILKRSATAAISPPHAVHFPPSPSLTRTFSVHSATVYDRSPIVVAPNSCALPARGCPGRTYTLDDPESTATPSAPNRGHQYGGRVLHPRALGYTASYHQRQIDNDEEAERHSSHSHPRLPPLIPDLSSESDESDGSAYLPEASDPTHLTHGLAIPLSHRDQYANFAPIDVYGPNTPSALSFLPYPPSPPSHSYSYSSHVEEGSPIKSRRRRDREGKHESSQDPDRIRSRKDSNGSPSKSNRKRSLHRPLPVCRTTSSFSINDDGCLGGF